MSICRQYTSPPMFSHRILVPGIFALTVVIGARMHAHAEFHFTVSPPGQGGQYMTIQAAIDAVPTGGAERYVIDVSPGTYTERVQIPSDKPRITLRGQDPLTTKITFNETANTPPNDRYVHATTVVLGKDFVAENLTFENSYGPGVQALAMYAKADRLIFDNVRFLGWQDTLRSEYGRHYFHNVYVEGSVDFIYGRGTAYFEDSTLFAKANGYLTAQARETAEETNGYVFKNTTVTGSANPGSMYLGRPWQPYSRTVFIDSNLGPIINPAGWSTWSGNNNHLTAYYAEYNSMDLDGNPLDVTQRVAWSRQLTAIEAEAFSKENWLGGSDGWNPVVAVLPELSGDYNDDGIVSLADYTVWRDNLGGSFDLNGNGDETGESAGLVDIADYVLWKSNFAAVEDVPGGGSLVTRVPEPAAGTLAIAGLLMPWTLGHNKR